MTIVLWQAICDVDDLVPDRGVAALLDRPAQPAQMVALFRLASVSHEHPVEWFAVDHIDPISRAPVMARGLVGSEGSVPIVSSPIDKRRYDLRTGLAMDGESPPLRCWPVRVVDGRVEVCTTATRHEIGDVQPENAVV